MPHFCYIIRNVKYLFGNLIVVKINFPRFNCKNDKTKELKCSECQKEFASKKPLKKHKCKCNPDQSENQVFKCGNYSDQNIECMHSYVDKQLKKGCYWTTVSTTKACGEKQHAGVLKINAYSVKLS